MSTEQTDWHQEWPCRCNRGDRIWHAHYPHYSGHSCARGCGCKCYEADIPEGEAIRILIGPSTLNDDAATVLLGSSSSEGASLAALQQKLARREHEITEGGEMRDSLRDEIAVLEQRLAEVTRHLTEAQAHIEALEREDATLGSCGCRWEDEAQTAECDYHRTLARERDAAQSQCAEEQRFGNQQEQRAEAAEATIATLRSILRETATWFRGWPTTTCHAEGGADVPIVLMNPANLEKQAKQLDAALAAPAAGKEVAVPESYTRLREAVYALDPAAADDKLHAEWDAAKWAVFNAAVRLVKEQAEARPAKEDA